MSDTLGGLIDKLMTTDLKMWNNQELLYKIRKMNVEEFKQEYFSSDSSIEYLFNKLAKCCDLNVQRNQFIDEIDEKIIEIIRAGLSGEELDSGKYIQRKHKTL